ncbi:MAG TPA: imidazole glycerol phosphate synthase subunit HisH, partial [Limnochordia bacterium]
MLAIIDYGMGNLRSVQKAFEKAGAAAEVTSDKARIEAAQGIVLPGVGAFGQAMRNLEENGLADLIRARIRDGVPFLGICLGLQLLFETSEERFDG